MNKLTKIVATIGPSTDSEEMIEKLIKAGVNVFRFNFKHNTVEWHGERLQRVNAVAEKMNVVVGTLIDLQGPEIRIKMSTADISVEIDDLILFGAEALESKEKGLSITHPSIVQYLTEGQRILADDGAFSFTIVKKHGKTYLKSESKGILKTNKTLNIPGADFPFPVLVERDYEGFRLAEEYEIDYIALSFVRSSEDLRVMKQEMKKYKLHGKVVAKIETQKACDDLDGIIAESDGLMVARGDLGVELPMEQVPYYQKIMIKKCLEKGIPVITATQMLQSMIDNPYPTRAEVSDIANATYDLTDAVMLSGETASGKYPLEAVRVMARTAEFNETKFTDDNRVNLFFHLHNQTAMMCDTAYSLYRRHLILKEPLVGFIVFSHTGKTVQLLSRYRPLVPIFALTPNRKVSETLSLNFGVVPIVHDVHHKDEVTNEEVSSALHMLQNKGYLKKGEKMIVLHGDIWTVEGGTSTVKMVQYVGQKG